MRDTGWEVCFLERRWCCPGAFATPDLLRQENHTCRPTACRYNFTEESLIEPFQFCQETQDNTKHKCVWTKTFLNPKPPTLHRVLRMISGEVIVMESGTKVRLSVQSFKNKGLWFLGWVRLCVRVSMTVSMYRSGNLRVQSFIKNSVTGWVNEKGSLPSHASLRRVISLTQWRLPAPHLPHSSVGLQEEVQCLTN